MEGIIGFLSGYKTYVAGFVTIITALLSMIGVELPGVPHVDNSTAVQMIVTAILAMFLRSGVQKAETAAIDPVAARKAEKEAAKK